MKRVLWLGLALAAAVSAAPKPVISAAEYRDRVYASWLGQCVGNIYGLAHEQKYFHQSGPDRFPLGYSGWGASLMKELNGAFSDDDTDIEYLYLLAMEQHGIEPRYADLAGFWRRHVRDKVWLANRAAVAAIRHGFAPPWTGTKQVNPHWFQIDPQLVNEIWAVTAPGMPGYAAGKSAWAARIMSDGEAIEPTVFYAAMYSAAFFERDYRKLIGAGKAALPKGAKFTRLVDRVIDIHGAHPGDWKAARSATIQAAYYGEPEATRTATNAHLNAAFAVLALLYGEGDFQRTLDLGCALGFDADNQTATLGGLLGIAYGIHGIPRELLFPLPEARWSEPLNDRYANVTREGLPNATLRDLAARTAALGEAVIVARGGRRIGNGGATSYEINPDAVFTPPLELSAGPLPPFEIGQAVTHEFLAAQNGRPLTWSVRGKLPRGIRFSAGRLSGIPLGPAGRFPITVNVRAGTQPAGMSLELLVRRPNLARGASKILTPIAKPDLKQRARMRIDTPAWFFTESPEALRDGRASGEGATFLSIGAGDEPREDYYGYEWAAPQSLGMLALTTGFIEEASGWFTELKLEYRDDGGRWQRVQNATAKPEYPGGNDPLDKAHFAEYMFLFDPVRTTAIRVGGGAGAAVKDAPRFTSVSELSVYAPLPGSGPQRRSAAARRGRVDGARKDIRSR